MSDIRVFVTVPIPDKAPLEEPARSLGSVRNVRASPLEQLHITLAFIGDVDEGRVDDIADCVRRAVDGVRPFTVAVSGAGAFPSRDRPSVVWVGASPQKALASMAGAIGRNLDSAGIGRDRKPFRSHVTLARCRGPADLSGFFGEYGTREFLSFECDRVLVMRSVLGPAGARHTVLREILLS